LRAAGHDVYPLTLSGLGERAHLIDRDIDLNTHARDVTALMEFEELQDVILVGHSYGCAVISAAAGVAPERMRQLVYIDGPILAAGESMADTLDPPIRELILKSKDIAAPPPPIDDDMAWWRSHVTSHPLETLRTPLPPAHPAAKSIPRTYIRCLQNPASAERVKAIEGHAGWDIREIDTDHFPMFRAPAELATLLLRNAS
jgi:pimeloyl-ACP methyl ester carboxylesterase